MRRIARMLSCTALVLILSTGAAIAGQPLFYHVDPAGTPIALSDANGNVVWRADYRPFGEIQSESGTAENNRLFVGKEKDDETGLYYFGARYMDDRLGRFISPDPIGAVDPKTGKINSMVLLNPQRQNYYAYALNNPYSYIDANGEAAASILRLGIQIGIKVSPRTASTIIGALGGGMIGQTLSDALLKEKSQSSGEGQNKGQQQGQGESKDSEGETTRPSGAPPKDLPARGEPNSTGVKDYGEGRGQIRDYGPDGKAKVDYDFGHDHGAGDPHAHDWNWSKEPPRQPGRPLKQGE